MGSCPTVLSGENEILKLKLGIKEFERMDWETIRLIDLKLASMKVPLNNLRKGKKIIQGEHIFQ